MLLVWFLPRATKSNCPGLKIKSDWRKRYRTGIRTGHLGRYGAQMVEKYRNIFARGEPGVTIDDVVRPEHHYVDKPVCSLLIAWIFFDKSPGGVFSQKNLDEFGFSV